MNLELLQNHIDSMIETIEVPKLAADGSNAQDFFCADVVSNRKFAQNFGGYPRSEIAEINDAANIEIQKSLLQQLTDYSTHDNPNAGLTDADIMLSHRSKYQQAPSEMQDWLVGQLNIQAAKRAETIAAYQAAQAKAVKAAKKGPDVVTTAEPE